jgi:hypothetical protein
VDEASLPKLETLTAHSDFRAFLASGVSAAVQSRALRVAWASDPTIAAFRGMAEYDWDFNAEGYGRLAASDDVSVLLRGVMGFLENAKPEPEGEHSSPPPLVGLGCKADQGWGEGCDRTVTASEPSAQIPPIPTPPPNQLPQGERELRRPRRHGGAMPA